PRPNPSTNLPCPILAIFLYRSSIRSSTLSNRFLSVLMTAAPNPSWPGTPRSLVAGLIGESRSRPLAQTAPSSFLSFEYRRILGRNRKWRAYYAPKLKKRTALLAKLREIFRQNVSQPVGQVIEQINPILRGW